MGKIEPASTADLFAVLLSALCIIHCMALPLMITLLPLAVVWLEAEWVHQGFVLAALLISGYGIFADLRDSQGLSFPVSATIGLGFLIVAAFIEPLHDHETLLTFLGGLILSIAHIRRWIQRNRLRAGRMLHNEY